MNGVPLLPAGAVQTTFVEPALPREVEQVYLHPGQMFAAAHRCAITTVLGSCVSVCLYDADSGVGGANHYLLPHDSGKMHESLRGGPSAIRALIDSVVSLGARRSRLLAKVFGGAHVLKAMTGARWHVGAANVEIARSVLGAERISVHAMHVGGLRGRKLRFATGDGAAWVKEI